MNRSVEVIRFLMETVALTNEATWCNAVSQAHSIRLSSYVLGKRTEVLLKAAAARGADVHVVLSGRCFGMYAHSMEVRNRESISRLQASGVDARLLSDELLHLKAACVDNVVFFDDQNWTGKNEMLVLDQLPADVRRIGELLDSQGSSNTAKLSHAKDAPVSKTALTKADALELELRLIAGRSMDRLDVQTETIGEPRLLQALIRRARRTPIRMMLSRHVYESDPRTRRYAAQLRKAGIRVRITDEDGKMALSGSGAWLGSANMSKVVGDSLDWGAQITSTADQKSLREAFNARWRRAELISARTIECNEPTSAIGAASDG